MAANLLQGVKLEVESFGALLIRVPDYVHERDTKQAIASALEKKGVPHGGEVELPARLKKILREPVR